MYFKDYFRLALSNISKKKTRFFLSTLSISIGIATVVFITSAGNSGMSLIDAELAKMGLNMCVIKSEKSVLSNEDIIAVQSTLGNNYYVSSVIKTAAEINMPGLKKECVLYGGDEEILSVFDYSILFGRNIRTDDLINYKKVVIIDKKLSERLFDTENSVGESLAVSSGGIEEYFTIIGVTDSSAVKEAFDEESPIYLFSPHTTVKSCIPAAVPTELYTLSKDGGEAGEEIKNTVNFLNGSRSAANRIIYKDMNVYKRNIDYIADAITLILAMIGAISLVSGGLGVINTMMMSVSERKGDIGIKKALGQTDSSVVAELIFEAVITMLAALIIGVITGGAISYFSLTAFDMSFIPDINAIASISMISFVMGIIFGFLPALKTFSMNPVEILK